MPVERTAERLRRILLMVSMVQARPRTVEELCARFDFTPEELSKDLDLLTLCGLPPFGPGDLIEATFEDGLVTIRMADYLDRPARLTRDEAVALLVMGRATQRLPGFADTPSLESALAKLADAITPTEADLAADLAGRIDVELGSAGADHLDAVRSAAAKVESLAIEYYSPARSEMTTRTIDPLLVFNAKGNWYVHAHDHPSDAERTFRVDRIRSATLTGSTFVVPEGFEADRFRDGPAFVPSTEDRRVVIDVEDEAAWLAEVIPRGRVTKRGKGRLRITVRTADLRWLVSLLLTAGPSARAVEPDDLMQAVEDAARGALARYGASL